MRPFYTLVLMLACFHAKVRACGIKTRCLKRYEQPCIGTLIMRRFMIHDPLKKLGDFLVSRDCLKKERL